MTHKDMFLSCFLGIYVYLFVWAMGGLLVDKYVIQKRRRNASMHRDDRLQEAACSEFSTLNAYHGERRINHAGIHPGNLASSPRCLSRPAGHCFADHCKTSAQKAEAREVELSRSSLPG